MVLYRQLLFVFLNFSDAAVTGLVFISVCKKNWNEPSLSKIVDSPSTVVNTYG